MNTQSIRTTLGPELLQEAEAFSEDITSWRRDFHQFPEPAYEEYVTASRITRILNSFQNVEVTSGYATPTTVVATIGEKNLPGPALMMRATTDSNRLEECTGLQCSSCMPGCMHASGNDAHIASLLATAKLLSQHTNEMRHPVVLLFQPGSENSNGAKKIIDYGFISDFNIGSAINLQWWPEVPYGQLITKKNVFTSLSDKIHIDIKGVPGSASEPHRTIDPILISAHIMIAIQSMLTRDVDPRDPVSVSFAKVDAGATYNIIPEHANLWGTLRAYSSETRDFVHERIEDIAPAIAHAFKSIATVEYTKNYDHVNNDSEFTERLLEIALPFFGKDGISISEKPLLMGDDFSCFSNAVPSVFMLLGTGVGCKMRRPEYEIPESMLPFSAAWETYMALTL